MPLDLTGTTIYGDRCSKQGELDQAKKKGEQKAPRLCLTALDSSLLFMVGVTPGVDTEDACYDRGIPLFGCFVSEF